MKTTELLSGFFDVRQYQDGKPREQWRMKSDDDNITFSVRMYEPGEFAQFAKSYVCTDGSTRHRVTFKIGRNCRWYNERAEQVERPVNAELDGQLFQVKMVYRTLIPDPNNDKSPRGYWVSAIMFRRVESNPFTAMEGSPAYVPQQQQPQQDKVQDKVPENVQAFFRAMAPQQVDKYDLPY